jgi:hypothetical protein
VSPPSTDATRPGIAAVTTATPCYLYDEEQLVARLVVAERILNLQTQVHQLSGLLPICCVCKKVRDDQNYWQQVESYISKRTDARFSHGYCPDCYKKVVKELEGCAGTKAGVAT